MEGKTTLRRFGGDGATLGDDLTVHIRSYARPPRMIIFGAVDFSAAMAPFASRIGYDVMICDARERFVHSERFSADAEVRGGWPRELMKGVALGPRDAVLVFSHDPKYDGLDIGSRTAEETAVSILAEIIAGRSDRVARPLRATNDPIHSRDGTRGNPVLPGAHTRS